MLAEEAAISPFGVAHGQPMLLLTVTLDLHDRELLSGEQIPRASVELRTYGQDDDEDKRLWRLNLSEFGDINDTSWRPPILPPQLLQWIITHPVFLECDSNVPVWLDLVRPYSFLGRLNWEAILCRALDRPVLRFPDFLEKPQENRDVLETAIIFDPPFEAIDSDECIAHLHSIVEATLKSSQRLRTRINVFTGKWWFDRLSVSDFDPRVLIHRPPAPTLRRTDTESAVTHNSVPAKRFWVDWISRALVGRTLDAMHFVGRASHDRTRTCIVLSSEPSAEDIDLKNLTFVDLREIGVVLTRLGAWAAIFSPSVQCKDSTMAFVADAFAHTKPCAVLYHRAAVDEQANLVAGLSFLFSTQPSDAPKISDGFLYCQPAHVSAHADFRGAFELDALTRDPALLGQELTATDVLQANISDIEQSPSWASVTQRYIEDTALNQLRLSSADVFLARQYRKSDERNQAPSSEKDSEQFDQLKQTLIDIQEVVARHLNNLRRE